MTKKGKEVLPSSLVIISRSEKVTWACILDTRDDLTAWGAVHLVHACTGDGPTAAGCICNTTPEAQKDCRRYTVSPEKPLKVIEGSSHIPGLGVRSIVTSPIAGLTLPTENE